MKRTFINIVVFNLAWLVCVGSAAAGVPIVGALVVSIAVALHLSMADNVRSEMLLLGVAALIGFAWESLLVSANVLDYGTTLAAPYWIVAMWILFATTINVSMRWLGRNWALAAVAGALGGPLSFIAGQRLGAVEFTDPVITPIVLGAGWAILMPALIHIARSFERTVSKQTPSGLQA